ncbi:MAG: hypothetical protein C4547_13465 [Phycisphaerales bacterium]|nr:MAG: hypothetical protein C4547_13465 [Phycisphaerales bacterium]
MAWLFIAPAPAQEDVEPGSIHPLQRKEEIIRDRVDRLIDRMFRLSEELAETEPESAARLRRALTKIGEAGVQERVEAVIRLLGEGGALHQARDQQEELVAGLERVLAILMQRDTDNEERRRQIQQLEEYRRELSDILNREKELRADSGDATARKRLGQQLDQAIERVRSLLNRQQQLSQDAAPTAPQNPPPGADPSQAPTGPPPAAAERQQALADQTDAVARDVDELAKEAQRLDGRSAPAPDGRDQSESPQGSDNTRRQDGPPPGDQAPPQGGQPEEGQSTKGQSQEGRPQAKPSPAGRAAGEASRSLKSASQRMSQAGKALEQSDAESAQRRQQEAEEQLSRALHELERAKESLDRSDRGGADQARAQEENADKAGALSQQMDRDRQGGESGENQEGQEGQPGQQDQQGQLEQQGQQGQHGQQGQQGGQDRQNPPTPGQDDLNRAEQEMRGAAEDLEQHNPEDAARKQDRAIDALEQAKQQLEQELAQKRKEEREEILRDLEARFRDMLARQKGVNETTASLNEIGMENLSRADRLQAADIARRQEQLARAAETCVHVLDEEGTTVVFPRILGQVAEDMDAVAVRLGDLQLGPLTQAVQAEIIAALEQLLDAVKRMQQENEQQPPPGGGPPPDGAPPLLPASAELKLLRAAQHRVHARTAAIDEAARKDGEPARSLEKAFNEAAARQRQCSQIAREILERENPP